MMAARIVTTLHPIGSALLGVAGGPAAAGFAVLHGAGNSMLTIAKGTLPLALFGPAGYALRTGLLSAPSRMAQAFAPLGFAWALDAWGAGVLWLTAGLSLASGAALLALRHTRDRPLNDGNWCIARDRGHGGGFLTST